MRWLNTLLNWIMYPKYMLWTTLFGIVFAICIIFTPHPWNYLAAGAVFVIAVAFGPRRSS